MGGAAAKRRPEAAVVVGPLPKARLGFVSRDSGRRESEGASGNDAVVRGLADPSSRRDDGARPECGVTGEGSTVAVVARRKVDCSWHGAGVAQSLFDGEPE